MKPTYITPGPFFIALSGKKQVGKDTSTDFIKDLLTSRGQKVAVTAFAEPLKEMCINILGLKRELVYGSNEDKDTPCHITWGGFSRDIRVKYGTNGPRSGPMTVREVLQVMGTDIFRAIDGDVWACAPFNRDWSGYDVVLLTDCRFPNEKRVTEASGGVIIRLERDTGFVDNHPSEIALDDATFDIKYVNNGTVNDLYSFLEQTLKNLKLI